MRPWLGRASLTYEEMATILTDVECVVNLRPLTYVSEDETLKPISPSMFLQENTRKTTSLKLSKRNYYYDKKYLLASAFYL